eukprot:TRINITY_DN28590_c0_g3_i1.p1 TRINITY_DN28590_c0_g3~~TRINITY_DN28590_c0_g3_i1.p1  ORF type:complete len:841 (+),score=69.98 TRINITY_DN28590_c0_g3_i1:94-2616(+)
MAMIALPKNIRRENEESSRNSRRHHSNGMADEASTTREVDGISIGEYVTSAVELLPENPELCLALLEALRKCNVPLESEEVSDANSAIDTFANTQNSDLLPDAVLRLQQRLHTASPLASPTNSSTAVLATEKSFTSSSGDCKSLPWWPDVGDGGFRQRCFLVLEDPTRSIAGKVAAGAMVATIAVSTISFVLESMPQLRERPAECLERLNRNLTVTVEQCEPRPFEDFGIVETVCVVIFTIEYLIRLAFAHSDVESGTSGLRRTFSYSISPLNIIDLLAILPYYIDLLLPSGNGAWMGVLRLFRILRLFKMAKHNKGMQMFLKVMVLSGQPLMLLLFFNVILVVIFGSLIYFAEGTEFSVDPMFTEKQMGSCGQLDEPLFPRGVFVRPDSSYQGVEVTPFRSIPYGIWWVCVTMTTVGYGDYTPSTITGKGLGLLVFYTGILFLALPVGVLSTNFETVYNEVMAVKAEETASKPPRRSVMKKKMLPTGPPPWLPATPCFLKKLFLVCEDPAGSKIGRGVSLLIITAILTSTVSFIVESIPQLNYTPEECSPPNITIDVCTPRPHPAFAEIETLCISIFTVEYLIRAMTVVFVRPDECGLESHESISGFRLVVTYCAQPLNLVDILAIIPFYIELATGGGGGVPVLRVLRLIRVFRLLKAPKLRACADMFLSVIADALPALVSIFLLTCMLCIFFAACIVFAEGSEYAVDAFPNEYPMGVYIRPTTDGHGIEPTPFISVIYAVWWFFTTATTVGYGDDYPTTTFGRIVAITTFYTGIVLVALPLTIVGGSFNKYYPEWVKEFQAKELKMDSPRRSSGRKVFPECPDDIRPPDQATPGVAWD